MDFYTVLLFFYIVLVQTGSPRQVKATRNKPVKVTHNKPKRLDIKCIEKSAVISSIDVTSGSNTNTCCVGKTPQLIVDALSCYWKPSCSVNFPTDIVLMPENSSQPCPGCIGSSPYYLILNEVRCFTKGSDAAKQRIVDICDETGNVTGNVSIDSGILRSHPQYPWEYDSNSFTKFSKRSPNHICKKTFWLTRNTPNLLVTVHAIDIDEGDFLNVTSVSMDNNVTTETITTNRTKVFYGHKSVEYRFEISQGTNGGMGFLICFKRFQGRYDQEVNACDELMEQQAEISKEREKRKCQTAWGCRWGKGKINNRGKTRTQRNRKKNDGKEDKIEEKKDGNKELNDKGSLEKPKKKRLKTRKKPKSRRNRNRERKPKYKKNT